MGVHVIRLPDVGEGVAEAKIAEWLVQVGDRVREDQALGSVMTDKATVEIPSPVDGEVLWLPNIFLRASIFGWRSGVNRPSVIDLVTTTFDPKKNAINLRRQGVSLADGDGALSNPFALTIEGTSAEGALSRS